MVKRGWKALTGVLGVLFLASFLSVFYLRGKMNGLASSALTMPMITPTTHVTFAPTATVTPTTYLEPNWWLGEPGVLLDASATWTIPGTEEVYQVLLPEGGYTYLAFGEATVTVGDLIQKFPAAAKRVYLLLIRGQADDGTSEDLNLTIKVSDFVAGHAIWSPMLAGTRVSKEWFTQQVEASFRSPNCGMGCQHVGVAFLDVNEEAPQWHFWQVEKDGTWKSIN